MNTKNEQVCIYIDTDLYISKPGFSIYPHVAEIQILPFHFDIGHNSINCVSVIFIGPILSDSTGVSSSETVGIILAVVSGGTILILAVFTVTFVCR